MPMSAQDIIHTYAWGKLSVRPEFYSGRGNLHEDLNSEILELVYGGIKKELGADAAKAFVNMVGEMTTDASATTFLQALYALEENDWKFEATAIPSSAAALGKTVADVRRKLGDEAATAVGLMGLFDAMSAPARKGDGIRLIEGFLEKHSRELNKEVPRRVIHFGPDGWGY